MALVKRECENCGAPVFIASCYIRRGRGRFCSISCKAKKIHKPFQDVRIRLFKKVTKSQEPDGCWIFYLSPKNNQRYGSIVYNGKEERVHRVSFILEYGNIPDGLVVRHRCDNTLCVNPSHLLLGTQLENIQDMVDRGRASRRKGSQNPAAKISESIAAEIRALFTGARGDIRRLSERFKISETTVSRVVNNKTWVS